MGKRRTRAKLANRQQTERKKTQESILFFSFVEADANSGGDPIQNLKEIHPRSHYWRWKDPAPIEILIRTFKQTKRTRHLAVPRN